MMVLFHCESNPGYAPSNHEHTFLDVARHFTGDIGKIHYAYASLDGGMTSSLPKDLMNVVQLDTSWSDPKQLREAEHYIKENGITLLLGFDQPVSRPMYRALRKGGVKTFVSYWGAPMSSRNTGWKLFLKKLEVSMQRYGPDHYIFQSTGMRETAFLGRGIPISKTSVIKSGIDTNKFQPDPEKSLYAHECFNIPTNRHIVIFSGHMERRKGVHVILQSAKVLISDIGFKNVQFLILGNREGEKESFSQYLQEPEVNDHITFGGYRSDVPDILKSCSIGMIASTEWDSFPMSTLEMAATELPLLVSDLPGLNEAVTDNTGLTFPIGDYVTAAKKLNTLLSDKITRQKMGKMAREKVLEHYSKAAQARGLIDIFEKLRKD
ncbi:glycosyltransferase family 4 protein [Marinobacter changyiensis]|uniref:glycosyltransferase family 4 protein n=1 Tax=Marinobacter changyiensis TaxID=2604091 RepID=UPI001FEC2446|nr:glycosyltransferase family 4 protein [Marinobacter changyiensis]